MTKLSSSASPVGSYTKGDAHYNWTAKAIDGARAKGVPWVIVGAHTPCLSMGNYTCTGERYSPGKDITNLLLTKRVDLVLHGHEHFYQRTKQLRNGVTGCSTLTVGSYDGDCVADADSSLSKGRGTVFATVGTGGTALRNVNTSDSERSYFVASSGANKSPTHGFLDLQMTSSQLSARFVGTNGTFSDAFTIKRDRYAQDEYGRTVADTWGTADVGGSYNYAGSVSSFDVTGDAGSIQNVPGVHYRARLSSINQYYTDMRVVVSLDSMPGGTGYYLRSDHRVNSAGKYYAAKLKITPDGGVYVALVRNGTSIKGYTKVAGVTYAPGERLHYRVVLSTRNPSKLRAKVWPAGTPEPAAWTVSVSDSTSGYQTSPGGWRFDSYVSSGATASVTASFDDLVVERA